MEPRRSTDFPKLVSRVDLESLVASVEQRVASPVAGIFGPESFSWRINRESALFLGAGRAAMLQLAHPWVAVALEQHSNLLNRPIARFHNTFRIVFTMIFGSAPQAFRASRSLHQLHTQIRGQLPSPVASYEQGSNYEANFIPALRWVYATLIESAVLAYETVLPPLTDSERAAYYEQSKTLAALFGIPSHALPADWTSFACYVEEMFASVHLGVDERSRLMAHKLLSGAGSSIRPTHWYRALTASWMPLRFREEFQLPFGPSEQRSAQRARRWLPAIYRHLPEPVRFVGPYHQACARLAHRKPGLLTRGSNRFWIGAPLLPFGESD
jgi:uncharacterized protein (DUF2236 family)